MINRVLKQILPNTVYKNVAKTWHRGCDFSQDFQLSFAYRKPEKLICFGIAPGDDLLCTAVLREIAKQGKEPVWMMSNYPELFQGNEDVDRVVPVVDRFQDFERVLGKKWRLLNYTSYDAEKDKNESPKRHIIAEMCLAGGVHGQIALRPYLHLTNEERDEGKWAREIIAIQSSGLGAKLPMRNKQWYPERFNGVVEALKAKYKFVQIGSTSDPLLDGASDFRGKTSIRETASILANARLFVGNVGFLMHLARASECQSVIVYGGREAPWQSGYSCNINLYSEVSCAPCWQWNRCDYDRICMDKITVTDVVRAIDTIIVRPKSQLTVDTCNV